MLTTTDWGPSQPGEWRRHARRDGECVSSARENGDRGADGTGSLVREQRSNAQRVISPVASAIVLDMLSDASARIPGFGTSTPFDFPFPVAVKTGTSRHFTDNWAVATTTRIHRGGVGGQLQRCVRCKVSAASPGAGPLLHRVVMETAKRVSPGALVTPAEVGAVGVPVCRLSGIACDQPSVRSSRSGLRQVLRQRRRMIGSATDVSCSPICMPSGVSSGVDRLGTLASSTARASLGFGFGAYVALSYSLAAGWRSLRRTDWRRGAVCDNLSARSWCRRGTRALVDRRRTVRR
jgi:membrane peptidoglycan carboxypeptidase